MAVVQEAQEKAAETAAEEEEEEEEEDQQVDLEMLTPDFILKMMRRSLEMGDEWVHLEHRRLVKHISTKQMKGSGPRGSGRSPRAPRPPRPSIPSMDIWTSVPLMKARMAALCPPTAGSATRLRRVLGLRVVSPVPRRAVQA